MDDYQKYCGWLNAPKEIKLAREEFQIEDVKFYKEIAGSGKGKTVLLYKIYEAVTGNPFPVWQQDIGDCVSFGYALGVTTLMAVQSANNDAELFKGISEFSFLVCKNICQP